MGEVRESSYEGMETRKHLISSKGVIFKLHLYIKKITGGGGEGRKTAAPGGARGGGRGANGVGRGGGGGARGEGRGRGGRGGRGDGGRGTANGRGNNTGNRGGGGARGGQQQQPGRGGAISRKGTGGIDEDDLLPLDDPEDEWDNDDDEPVVANGKFNDKGAGGVRKKAKVEMQILNLSKDAQDKVEQTLQDLYGEYIILVNIFFEIMKCRFLVMAAQT
jgi:hypothetical protein